MHEQYETYSYENKIYKRQSWIRYSTSHDLVTYAKQIGMRKEIRLLRITHFPEVQEICDKSPELVLFHHKSRIQV